MSPYAPGSLVEQVSRYRPRSARPRSHRLYDTARWKWFRRMVIQARPECEECLEAGLLDVRAVEVHHIVALEDGGAQLDEANVAALCKSCHSRHTLDERVRGNSTVRGAQTR